MNTFRSIGNVPSLRRWLAVVAMIVVIPPLGSFFEVGAQQTRQRQVGGPKPREEEGQTIRVGTQLVNVLFSVTDKENFYVNDLEKSEVSVLENGKPQQIFTFKREFDLPLTMAMLVDVSNSVIPVLPRLTTAGSRFINSVVRPTKDLAAVIQFNIDATLIQDLTSNPPLLRRGLREIARAAAAPQRDDDFNGPLPPLNSHVDVGGTSIYDSIVAACKDLLASRQGRKTIILFTDGFDTTSRVGRSDAIDEALRAEVVIYAIGIGDMNEEGVHKKELNKLCEPTGGRAFIPRSSEDLDRAFMQLEQELRQQYLLAYEPLNETADGTFRKIEVRVNNRKGIHIRHRRGYYASRQ